MNKIVSSIIKGAGLLILSKLALSGFLGAMDLPYKLRDPYYRCSGSYARGPYPVEDYARDTGSSLESGIWTLTSPDHKTEVILMGVIHFAEPQFYESLNKMFRNMDYVIVEGGVGEGDAAYNSLHPMGSLSSINYKEGILKSQGDYLDMYKEGNPAGLNLIKPDATMTQLIKQQQSIADYIYWSDYAIKIGIAEWMYPDGLPNAQSKSSLKNFAKDLADLEGNYTEQALVCYRDGLIMDSLSNLESIAGSSDKLTRIAIPWGDGHDPDLLRRLEEKGYTVSSHQFLTVFSYK